MRPQDRRRLQRQRSLTILGLGLVLGAFALVVNLALRQVQRELSADVQQLRERVQQLEDSEPPRAGGLVR